MFESLLPPKRFERRIVDFLERDECAALAAAPDLATRFGRRDRAMLLQTSVRVSELIGLTVADAVLGPDVQAHIFCQGKGRRHRTTPLREDVKRALQQWLNECPRAPHRHRANRAQACGCCGRNMSFNTGQAGQSPHASAFSGNGIASRWLRLHDHCPCGSGMNRLKPRNDICTQTCRLSLRRWIEPVRMMCRRGFDCWHSLKRCNYADIGIVEPRDIRMAKLRQKISGTYRNADHTQAYCGILNYLLKATARSAPCKTP